MAGLEPFEPAPLLAAAVSGGADSLALAVLAADWARARCGTVFALVVDHGLRPESGAEARLTAQRLRTLGIGAQVLALALRRGPGLAARAREARYEALIATSAAVGALHLLVGHHAADQAETIAHRVLRGSGTAGLAGMAAVVELSAVRVLRPLLAVPPERLRATLQARGVEWVEDPSNQDPATARARLRQGLSRHNPAAAAIDALSAAASVVGWARSAAEARIAATLASSVTLRPEGFALLPARGLPVAALRALIQAISGAPYPPAPDAVATLAAAPTAATLAGVRLMPAGRLGDGWLMLREAAAMAPPVAAMAGVRWDGRFRLAGVSAEAGLTLGALGKDAARFRDRSALPGAVLRTLPALRDGETLVAVPHLRYAGVPALARLHLSFAPAHPACGARFGVAAEKCRAGTTLVRGLQGGCRMAHATLC